VLILGLDIASVTGFCWYDTTKDLSAMEPGSFKLQGESHEQKAADMGLRMVKMIKTRKPDFIAIEAPLKNVKTYTKTTQTLIGEQEESTMNPAAVILPNQLAGAVLAVVGAYQIPWHAITEGTWRKQWLGFGRQRGWDRKMWKKAVREKCDQLGIVVTNDDQADAVGVSFAAPASETYRMVVARHERQGVAA
jgi:hypothetical protein